MDSEEHTSAPRATRRSTLEDNFSPYDDASLSLGEAKQDLESLKWQECSDQSIETVLYNHKTNDEVKSNGHDDALRSFVRSSQEEERSRRMIGVSSIVDYRCDAWASWWRYGRGYWLCKM